MSCPAERSHAAAAERPAPDAAASVAIVGLGLVGGSLARALVLRGVPVHGWAASDADNRDAARSGVQVAAGLAALAATRPELVVLAVPLGALAATCEALLPLLPAGTLVLHVAGLQGAASTGLTGEIGARVLGTHPMAGTHEGGFAASRPHLFHEAVVSAEARADADARARLEWLWHTAGAGPVRYVEAGEHDATMAWVSHLPQLAAVAMAAALSEAGVPETAGGPGLRGATRLAASPLAVWRDLLQAAPPETERALAAMAEQLELLRAELRGRGAPPRAVPARELLHTVWERARRWRGVRGTARDARSGEARPEEVHHG